MRQRHLRHIGNSGDPTVLRFCRLGLFCRFVSLGLFAKIQPRRLPCRSRTISNNIGANQNVLPKRADREEPMRRLTLLFIVITAALVALPALAENYPARPIRLYVAFPPGGAADIVARLVAQPLSERLGQPVVVENKPGSGGNIVGELIARAAPDGYSLLIGPDNLFTINPHLFGKMSFDPMKDIVPIATIQTNQLVLAINPKVPAQSFKEFIALAGRTDPPLFYASIGNGSLHHIAMEMLKEEAGIKLAHVPYRGGGPAGIAVLAGDVAAMFGGGSVFPMVKSGQLRGLAVSSRNRSAELPDLPSISDLYPNYEATIWQGLFAPAGTPPDIVDKLRRETGAILETKDFADKLAKTGSGEPYVTTLDEFKARMHRDFERYGRIVKAAGVQVQ
jgi:tripartite-type tricarboxylate transporter receptor subunit TctC